MNDLLLPQHRSPTLLLLLLLFSPLQQCLQNSSRGCDATLGAVGCRWDGGSSRSSSAPASRRMWLWAVRHGQAEHNVDPVAGWRIPDPHLTDIGWQQASAAAEQLPCGAVAKQTAASDHCHHADSARSAAPCSCRHNLSLVISSPLRRCIQTAVAALRRLPAPVAAASRAHPVPLLLHPDLQEIYSGPADTGRSATELLLEFAGIQSDVTDSVVVSHPVPSWLRLNVSLLEERKEWFLEKERLPKELSVTKEGGRRLFARRQANALLKFLHSDSLWVNGRSECAANLDHSDAEEAARAETDQHADDMNVAVFGHAGALGALLPDLPAATAGRKHRLRNGQVVRYLLEIGASQCRFERVWPVEY